ncbi:Os04g0182250 [Oryza sativa Japonica Group]|uniref:Os04g0182250 protein n=1 Tax=Oryza sativa subsp. japonica TaxID=39947 RepID=A0A0P0W733_ORYSJ|nr:hypothetical protein EE612_022310 [Oryza sativa]BAS87965.1 Os04g0182250 [Oryza sativa Japonica Group]
MDQRDEARKIDLFQPYRTRPKEMKEANRLIPRRSTVGFRAFRAVWHGPSLIGPCLGRWCSPWVGPTRPDVGRAMSVRLIQTE